MAGHASRMNGVGMTTLLYVRGNDPHAPAITAALEERFDVLTAATAADASRLLSERPDVRCLLCTDCLSHADPFDLFASIRRETPALPIVFAPKTGSEALAARAVSANVTEYLPYDPAPDHPAEVAETVGRAIDDSRHLLALRERLKELRGIREVARLFESSVDRPLSELLWDVVTTLPDSFQYPPITEVRLTVGDTAVSTDGFERIGWTLSVETITENDTPVRLEVGYREPRPEADHGPFLSEEHAFCLTVLTLVAGGVERRRSVEALEKSERLFRELAENLTEVLWVSDASKSEMRYVNPAYESVWGRSRQSLYDDAFSFLDAVHPDDRHRAEAAITASDDEYEVEYRIALPNGGVRWISDRGIPVFDEEGALYRFVGLAEDVTERKRRRQQLAVLHRVLRHNLRNDLNAITGYADLISTTADGETADYAEIIRSTGDRLVDLIEKQQEIATHVEAFTRPGALDLAALLTDVKAEVLDTYPNAEISLHPPAESTVTLPPQLELAVAELVRNAVEHTDEDPPFVDVSARVRSDRVVITVTDTGPGIPDVERAVLGTEEEPLFHGSGTGLWLVHWIVTNAGGTLQFEENEPTGSIVTIELPQGGSPG